VEALSVPVKDEVPIVVSDASSIRLVPARVNTREIVLDPLYPD
jgi:hypothetical protein